MCLSIFIQNDGERKLTSRSYR